MDNVFVSCEFPTEGGPDGSPASLEAKGIKRIWNDKRYIIWPSGILLPSGHIWQLLFDENQQPTHWEFVRNATDE